MKSIEGLLTDLASVGIEIWLEGDAIRFKGVAASGNADLQALRLRRSETVAHLREQQLDPRFPPLEPQKRPEVLPLSASQRMWFPVRPHVRKEQLRFIIPLHLTGPLAPRLLESSFRRLIERHEVLRTRYVPGTDGAAPRQIVHDNPYPALQVIDLSGLDANEMDKRMWEALKSEQSEAIADFASGQMVKAKLFKRAGNDHVLHIGISHIAFDPQSSSIFIRDLFRFYQSEFSGDEVNLAPLPLQYADYALWERRWLDETQIRRNAEVWQDRLAGLSTLCLAKAPVSPDGPPALSYVMPITGLSEVNFERVAQTARTAGVTPTVLLLGAVTALLSRWSETERILVGYPVDGRPVALNDIIGCFSRIRPFLIDFSDDPTLGEVLIRAKAAYLQSIDRRLGPDNRFLDSINLERVLINIVPQGPDTAPDTTLPSGLSLGPWRTKLSTRTVMTPQLEVRLNLWRDRISGHVAYAGGRIDEDRLKAFTAELPHLISRCSSHPDDHLPACLRDTEGAA